MHNQGTTVRSKVNHHDTVCTDDSNSHQYQQIDSQSINHGSIASEHDTVLFVKELYRSLCKWIETDECCTDDKRKL